MQKKACEMIDATIGFALGTGGAGVAYGCLRSARGERLIRVTFHVTPHAGLEEREAGYAALTSVAAWLRERGIARVRFHVADAQLVEDVQSQREVPAPLIMPYVLLGCTLNRFERCDVLGSSSGCEDVSQRARADVAYTRAA